MCDYAASYQFRESSSLSPACFRRTAMSPQFIFSLISALVLAFAAVPALLAVRQSRRQQRSSAQGG